jgi:Sulfotransferase family
MSAKHRPVLVVGLPRSGTTWTESILGTAVDASIVSEPDNEKLSAPAIWAKRSLGRFPVMFAGDEAPAYRRLWRWALTGAPASRSLRAAQRLVERSDPEAVEQLVKGRPSPELRIAGILGSRPGFGEVPGVLVAKSVHACLAIDWLVTEFDLDVLVVLRHPANVLSSWLELDLPDQDRDLASHPRVGKRFLDVWDVPLPGSGPVERAAWQVGLLTAALEEFAHAHTDWVVRTHEQICTDPDLEFRSLFLELGLTWGPTTSELVELSDKPGSGFTLNRKSSELADSWRTRLDPGVVDMLGRVLRPFPIKTWDPMDLSAQTNGSTEWLAPRTLRYPR